MSDNPIIKEFKEALELRASAKEAFSQVDSRTTPPSPTLNGRLPGGLDAIVSIYDSAISKLTKVVETYPKFFSGRYYLALFGYEKLTSIRIVADASGTSVPHTTDIDTLLKTSLDHVEAATGISSEDSNSWTLWGMLILEKAKNVLRTSNNSNHGDYESYLVLAAEKFIRALDIESDHAYAWKLLSDCMSDLINGSKDRNRTGLAVYHIAGEFMKEGGSVKNWKTRWFVVDDSSIAYYKDKETWGKGPVRGAPAKPQGTVFFSDVLDISGHDDPNKCGNINNRPKSVQQKFCLHVLTQNRTFNIIGFENKEQQQQWLKVMKNILRFYNVKKKAKKLLRDKPKQEVTSELLEIPSEFLNIELENVDNKKASAVSSPRSISKKDSKNSSPLSGSPLASRVGTPNKGSFLTQSNGSLQVNSVAIAEDASLSRSPPASGEMKEIIFHDDNTDDFGFKITGDLTFDGFVRQLRDMDNATAQKYSRRLLKQLQREGLLVDMIQTLIHEDPKQFLCNVTDISQFRMARYGALRKMEKIIEKDEIDPNH